MSKKYNMVGINKWSGAMWEVELKNPKSFSNDGLKDMVLFPKENPRKIGKIVRKNTGARGFFDHTAREFGMAINDIEADISKLEGKILKRTQK